MSHSQPLTARRIPKVNWIGLHTLYMKEVRRFLKVWTQTLVAPVVTTLLFLAIFTLALSDAGRGVADVPFAVFLAPGLVVMAISQNAFANTSSSMVISKVQGNIVDILMPPLGPGELVWAFTLGGVTRGLLVGIVTLAAMSVAVPLPMAHPLIAVYFAVMGSAFLALLGLAGGIWADKFDHIAAVTNFVVTPLTFLSGTFYSIDRLPEAARIAAHFNPFFYMIDGFRFGVIGHGDGTHLIGMVVMAGVNAALCLLCFRMLKTGYKLKP